MRDTCVKYQLLLVSATRLVRAERIGFKNAPFCRELSEGIAVTDDNGNRLGESKTAAQTGIAAVVLSRIAMSSPGMSKFSFLFIIFSGYLFSGNL